MAHYTTILFSAAAALLLLLPPLSGRAAAAPTPVLGMPGCNTSCGNLSVPYPFGMGPSYCYMPGFNLSCDHSSNPPRLLLGDGTLQVAQDINLSRYFLTVVYTGDIKIDRGGHGRLRGGLRDDGPYALWDINQLILVGCNVRATLKNGNVTMSSCSTFCQNGYTPSDSRVPDDSRVRSRQVRSTFCSGRGCCQAPIVVNREVAGGKLVPITSYDVELEFFGWNRSDGQRWPARVFVARSGWFATWSSHRLSTLAASMEVPVWIQWEVIDDHTDQRHSYPEECPPDAARRVCKSNHSKCNRGERGGYLCLCKGGYHGNPYITNGCQDIDECEHLEIQPTWCYGQCTNTNGSFHCRCPQGTHGDPYKPGGCFSILSGNCNTSCGNMSVPYPFGIGSPKCYLPGFKLTCDTSHDPPRLMLQKFRVVNIYLHNSTMRVIGTDQVHGIYGGEGGFDRDDFGMGDGDVVPYSLSTSNELILMGCDVQAGISSGSNGAILSGCSSFCSSNKSRSYDAARVAHVDDDGEYCYGNGCCQAHISMSRDGMPGEFWIDWIDTDNGWDKASPPSYSFIAEEGWFNRSRVSAQLPPEDQTPRLEVPIVLDWEILQLQSVTSWLPANVNSSQRQQQYLKCPGICRSKNSFCKPRSRGYTCHCSQGYDGNPYLTKGCTGGRKFSKGMDIVIGVASGFGIILSVLGAFNLSKKLKNRRAQIMKRRFFKQNRGQLLQQLVSQKADITERMIISLEELERATNNFDKARELGGGGHGTVYKGILSDLHVVAIKKPKKMAQKEKEIREFINEVAILSQINHRNVVKLYGCCLETEVPMLVYEFISNGTLYEHLHVQAPKSLSWNDRLRIATEAAKSLAYLHSAAATPIIHRDVKSANILLDDTLTAKVADFGASRYVPMDISGVTTRAQGTRGYWDPMNFYTGRITEKSDVYSFGVILVELLTREKPFSYLSSDEESLVAHFATLFEKGQLLQILDPQVMEEGGKKVEQVASIAVACIKLSREDRPSMRQVELALEGTRTSMGQTSDNASPSAKVESNTKGSTRRYSMELEFRLSAEHPR